MAIVSSVETSIAVKTEQHAQMPFKWFDLVRNFRKRSRSEAGSVLAVRAFCSKPRERRAQAASVCVDLANAGAKSRFSFRKSNPGGSNPGGWHFYSLFEMLYNSMHIVALSDKARIRPLNWRIGNGRCRPRKLGANALA